MRCPRIKKKSLKIGSVDSNSQKIINLEKFTSFYAIASEIIAYFTKKFANQNEMYFNKSQKEFKLGNSSLRNSSLGILV